MLKVVKELVPSKIEAPETVDKSFVKGKSEGKSILILQFASTGILNSTKIYIYDGSSIEVIVSILLKTTVEKVAHSDTVILSPVLESILSPFESAV